MYDPDKIDILIVGAGPAGLAAAIQLKKRLNKDNRGESVVVIDKAPKLGYHNLSGSVFEGRCLDDLIPGWKEDKDDFVRDMLEQRIETDEVYFLTKGRKLRIPGILLPKSMKHKGDYAISVGKLAAWMGGIARSMGVEVYTRFSADDLIIENNSVKGIILTEKGLNREGKRKSNYMPGEALEARATVFADGSQGALSTKLIEKLSLNTGKNPQVYSLGVKQLIRLPEINRFGKKGSIHTIGYPSKWDVFGGGFMYDMGQNVLAIGIILGLDWRYCDLDPQQELELIKSHPFIAAIIEDGEIIATGVKTIPEGGYYALPKPYTSGAIIVGDSAGFVNIRKFKGVHLAIKSGMAAGDTLYEAILKNDFSEAALKNYMENLENYKVLSEMYSARNFRQVFATKAGILLGMPLSLVQHLFPFRLRMRSDCESISKTPIGRDYKAPLDGKTFVSLSGTMHNEDLLPHIKVISPGICKDCKEVYEAPCREFCPGKVYTINKTYSEQIDEFIIISSVDCMHCKTCVIKCPYQNIMWRPPEGGLGPKYRSM